MHKTNSLGTFSCCFGFGNSEKFPNAMFSFVLTVYCVLFWIDLEICTPNWTYVEHNKFSYQKTWKETRSHRIKDKKSVTTQQHLNRFCTKLFNCWIAWCRNWMLRIKLNKLLLCQKVALIECNTIIIRQAERRKQRERCIGRSWWTKWCNSWKMSVCHLRRTIC